MRHYFGKNETMGNLLRVDFISNFSRECQEIISAVGREHLNRYGLQEVPSLVNFPNILICKLTVPENNSTIKLLKIRIPKKITVIILNID